MKIRQTEVIVTSPSRNFVTVKITTDDGIVGYGDGTLNGRELAVVSYLTDHVLPQLEGRDPQNIEDTWQLLYRGAYWRRGPVTMAAIAAVDMALWDIKAKAANLPLYQLLGGASRERIAVYCHATGRGFPELFDSINQHLDEGYRNIRIQSGVPGLERIYGVSDGSHVQGNLPVEEQWDTPAYLRHAPAMFEAVRNQFGAELPLLHDAHHRLTPNEAAQLGRDLEPYKLFWLEDVTPLENQEAMRRVRQQTITPLATGEVFNSVFDYHTLITEQLIDYVRSSVTHAGGITAMKKLLDFAALYQVKSGMHGPTDISPVGMAAALHLDLAIHNFGMQEYIKQPSIVDEVFPHAYSFADGYMHPGNAIGLGVEVNEPLAQSLPYAREYLPVNRLLDGTVHDW